MPLKDSRLCAAAVAVIVAAWAVACGDTEKPGTEISPPPGAKQVDVSKTGRVAGRVQLDGPVPAEPPINVPMDAVCSRELKDAPPDAFVTNDGGLENVFVSVKDGLDGYYFETPADPVRLDQKGCRYSPKVFGVRVGQPIEFTNSDPTVHNVHAIANANRGFNFTQQIAGMRDTRTFKAREVMVHVKCDVHPWMHAYAGVLDHPYLAVTASGGRFDLKNVPPGSYTVEAWHEKLGTRTQKVTVREGEGTEISFRFSTTGS